MTKKKHKKMNYDEVKLIIQNLYSEQSMDGTASFVMECLEDKVSAELLHELNLMLAGFCGDMQLEIADDLIDFVCSHVLHTTGCPAADIVLASCYDRIAQEKGIKLDPKILSDSLLKT